MFAPHAQLLAVTPTDRRRGRHKSSKESSFEEVKFRQDPVTRSHAQNVDVSITFFQVTPILLPMSSMFAE